MGFALGGGGLSSDDLDRASRDSEIRDKAIKWFQTAEKEIAALAGRESTSAERAVAQLMVVAELAAKMYGDLRKEFGAPTAQTVLKDGFALVGGIMRRNGEDVQMRVAVEFSKVAGTEPDQHYAAAEKPEVCECARDQDGRCAECISVMRGFCSKIGETVKIVREANLSGQTFCRPCFLRHMDGVLAEFVRRDLSTVDPDSADAMMKTLFMSSQSVRAMPMPLTMKAWDELQKGRGS